MKKFLGIVLALACAVTACFALAGCKSEDDNTLVVYTEAGFAPFEYEQNGAIVGVDVDIMNLVGTKLGMTVKFENVAFDTIVDAVSEGKLCDIGAAGLSVTAARKEKVVFSSEYYTANLYVVYKTSEASTYVSAGNKVYWDSLAGKKIAVQTGTTADLFLGDELAEGGTIYDTNASKVDFAMYSTALASAEKDVIIMDELPAQMLVAGTEYSCAPLYYKGDTVAEDEAACDVYAIAVCPNAPAKVLNAINEVIAELGATGIQNLVNTHLGLTSQN